MTTVGLACGLGHATIWADTLVTESGRPNSHAPKLVVNPLVGAIGVSAGMLAVVREGGRALQAADSLAAAVPAIAHAMRSQATKLAERRSNLEPCWLAQNVFALAAWDPAQDRTVAFEFTGADFFVPRQTRWLAWPKLEIGFVGQKLSTAEVRDAVARQAGLLRECGHGVGWLTIATLTGSGIVVLPPCEIPASHADPAVGTVACDVSVMRGPSETVAMRDARVRTERTNEPASEKETAACS